MSHSNIQEREKERWRGSFALIRNDCYANSFQRELTTEVGGRNSLPFRRNCVSFPMDEGKLIVTEHQLINVKYLLMYINSQ